VAFEDSWLIRFSFITKDEMKLVSLPGPNSHKKEAYLLSEKSYNKRKTFEFELLNNASIFD
jgi:hypothetical protein